MNPEEISAQKFTLARRGYEPSEVDAFLLRLVAELRSQDDFNRAGTEVATALRSFHHSVLEIQSDAEASAERLRTEADAHAERVRREADEYATSVRAEAQAEVEQARASAESELTARRAATEAECTALEATAQDKLAETEQLLMEAEEAVLRERAEAETYQAEMTALAERSARARAVTAVEQLRDDIARLSRERENARDQLRMLTEAISNAIGTANPTVLDLTDDATERAGRKSSGGDDRPGDEHEQLVEDVIDAAVEDAILRPHLRSSSNS